MEVKINKIGLEFINTFQQKGTWLVFSNISNRLFMSGFAKGIYFVRIEGDGSAGSPTNVMNRKIIVN